MTLWSACGGLENAGPISATLYRLVESQEQVATLSFVDTLEEQAVLETLLDQSKPSYSDDVPGDLHYLLRTPFRYPPLDWGSRFGRSHEPSLFYGGQSMSATLHEAAFYRFIFWDSMAGPAPSTRLITEHSVFSIGYRAAIGVQLQCPPFDAHAASIAHKTNYALTQQLGSDMRAAGVQAFQYPSARSGGSDICAGLFSPKLFTRKQPTSVNPWLCELSQHQVVFKPTGSAEIYRFSRAQFEVEGIFPLPASV